MKVALYARVSSDRQDVDLSISAQLRALREHASSNGYEVVREYVDEAESGRSAARPCFQRMIADSRRAGCPFKIILIWKYSRFARNREDSIVYKALLRRHGVQVVSITEPADDSPTGKLFEAIIESLDEFYSANLAQETLRGMRESASRGSYVAPTPPFGYRRVKITDRDRRRITLEPDPETAPVVRRIFRDAVHSNGLKEICQQLNREGIGRRGRAWTKNGLYRLLTNEAYTGVLVWGRASRNGHSVCPIRVEGAWEPLVDRDTFDQVRTTLRERSFAVIHPTRVSSRYLLSGIVRCGRCNTALIG